MQHIGNNYASKEGCRAKASRIVRVELELPENVWKALCLVAEKFEETPDEWVCQYILRELEADVVDHFHIYHEEYFASLSRAVRKLLEESAEDPH